MQTIDRQAVDVPPVRAASGPDAGGEFTIEGWLVQPSLNRITRGEQSVRLRKQLMDLLLCLASRPGKLIPKDELMATVWEGRFIAGSAFSRCIAELRAALGDDAHQPRVIETIFKRGYRLIAKVEAVPNCDVRSEAAELAPIDPQPWPVPADSLPRRVEVEAPSLWQRVERRIRILASRPLVRA